MAKSPEEIQKEISNFVNSYGNRSSGEEFCKLMSNDHRTLQQNFTRLCLQWLETVASDDYRTDGRNEASKNIAQELIGNFQKEKCNILPSKYLPNI
jgi:hypothetical protein